MSNNIKTFHAAVTYLPPSSYNGNEHTLNAVIMHEGEPLYEMDLALNPNEHDISAWIKNKTGQLAIRGDINDPNTFEFLSAEPIVCN